MLPPSGMPPEITDAWTTPGAWLMRSTICANAGAPIRRRLARLRIAARPARSARFGVEARIDAHQRDEAADEERRADEQHHGERDLGDDERAAQPLTPGAGARAARAVLQRVA